MLARLRAWLGAVRARRAAAYAALRPARPTVTATDAGFALRDPDGTLTEVAWTQIQGITALKLDLYTADSINLLVSTDATADATARSLLAISEESPGFAHLFGPMERVLGVSPAWYVEIMTPAFEATPRVLYTRADVSTEP